MLGKLVPVQKRAGMRKVARKRPVKITSTNIFLNNPRGPLISGSGSAFPKKLTDYKYLISTNFTTDELCSLILFSGWVKANESYLDSHHNFPIYGIITSPDKKETATTFLKHFAEIFGWDGSTIDLYTQYNSALKRVWSFGEERVEVSATNLIYLNFADYSFMGVGSESINIGGKNSRLLPPSETFLTRDTSPKLFELLNSLPTGSESGSEEDKDNVSASVKMLLMLVNEMYDAADRMNEHEAHKLVLEHSGNVIPLKSQYYILGMIGADGYSYSRTQDKKIQMNVKNTASVDTWLDTVLKQVFFDL